MHGIHTLAFPKSLSILKFYFAIDTNACTGVSPPLILSYDLISELTKIMQKHNNREISL